MSHNRADPTLLACARERGTPLYVYDLDRLRERIEEVRVALSSANIRLFFATMANDRLPVLRLLSRLHLGACVNSIPHLNLARAAEFEPSRIQFTSTGLTRADMHVLVESGVRTNLDSISQVESWLNVGGEEVGVRVNANSLCKTGPADRIGIESSEVAKAADIAAKAGGCVTGLHVYLGTNFQTPAEMLPTLEKFFELAATLPRLSYINIGGGIGVDYSRRGPVFDLDEFGAGLSAMARRLRTRTKGDIEIIVEPGRTLVADSATFVTAVTDVKYLHGERFAAVDASIALFPRPFHHPESPHRIRQLGNEGAADTIPTIVVGRTTFSRDILGSAALGSKLDVGDLLAIYDAGAYSASMASRFLGQPEPAEVFVGR